MNFLASFQAERLIAQIRTHGDASSAEAKKRLQKLAKLGPRAIPKILNALADSDKNLTRALTELLAGRTPVWNEKNLSYH